MPCDMCEARRCGPMGCQHACHEEEEEAAMLSEAQVQELEAQVVGVKSQKHVPPVSMVVYLHNYEALLADWLVMQARGETLTAALNKAARYCEDGTISFKCSKNGNEVGRSWGGLCPIHAALAQDAQKGTGR